MTRKILALGFLAALFLIPEARAASVSTPPGIPFIGITLPNTFTLTGCTVHAPSSVNCTAVGNGVSGGVPYFASSTDMESTAALTANNPIFGAGPGSPPFSGTISGNTTDLASVSGLLTSNDCLKADAIGNIITTGAICNVPSIVFSGNLAGSANTYTMAATGFALTDQNIVQASINATNTGASTLNINSTGAEPIKKNSAGLPALAGGELVAGTQAIFVYDAGCTCYTLFSTTGQTTLTVTSNKTATQADWVNGSTYTVQTASITITLPVSTSLGTGGLMISAIGHSVTLAINAADAINFGTTGASVTIPSGVTSIVTTDGAGNIFATNLSVGGSGTVTSVALTVPSFLSVAGSPITTTGTLAVSLATESANLIFAGQSSGSAAAPTFRSLVLGDLPQIGTNAILGNATSATAVPTALSMPSCSGASNALTWTTNTGIGCNTISGSLTGDAAGHVQLQYSSATSLNIAPVNGNAIQINGTVYNLPSGGFTCANTSVYVNGTASSNLAASTLYYVYAYRPSSTILCDFWSGANAVHMTDTTAGNIGVEVRNNASSPDSTRTLIGMVYTNGSSQFASTASLRTVRSWFNAGRIDLTGADMAGATSGGTSYGELGSGLRITFLSWANETISSYFTGSANNSVAVSASLYSAIGANSTTTASGTESRFDQTVASDNSVFAASYTTSALTEGLNYFAPLGKVSGTSASGTWVKGTITATLGGASGGGGTSGGASSASFHPGFTSGQYYTMPITAATATLTMTANRLYAIPFYVPFSQTFTKISINVTTNVASTACELGIYNNNNGLPSTLFQDSGNVATTATGQQEVTSLTISLSAGWYFLAVGCNGTPSLRASSTSGTLNTFILGWVDGGVTAPGQLFGSWTYSVGGLPGTFPTTSETANDSPLVFVRL